MIFSSVRIDGAGDSMVAFTAASLRRGEERPCQVDGQGHPTIDLILPCAGGKNFASSLC